MEDKQQTEDAAAAAAAQRKLEDAAALAQKQGQQAAVEAAKNPPKDKEGKTEGPPPVGVFQHASNNAHIKLDGIAKTLPMPVTGRSLHRLAGSIDGHPVVVKSGGSVIANTDEPVDAKFLEFTTK